MTDFTGKHGLVVGVANKRSIAWAIAQATAKRGARLALTYQGRFEENVQELSEGLPETPLIVPCDVTSDSDIEEVFKNLDREFGGLDFLVHGAAFARKEELSEPFVNTSREGFRLAMDISAYSLIALARGAAPLMERRSELQRDGRGEGCARSKRSLPCGGSRPEEHSRERRVSRSHQDHFRDGDRRILEHSQRVSRARTTSP